MSLTDLTETVVTALPSPDPLAEKRPPGPYSLEPLFHRHSPALSQDPHPQVVRLAKQLAATGVRSMLTTVEKLFSLKAWSVYSRYPEDVLAESVAALLEELDIPAGETFLHKGDLGSSLLHYY
ncbi:MAG: hypothetical protein U0401_27275 [Anaerolineae bacterium]